MSSTGERIRYFRERKGLSQKTLAEMCGLKPQTLFKYEKDIVTNIPLDTATKIAEILEVEPAVLLGWETSEGNAPKQEKKQPLVGATVASLASLQFGTAYDMMSCISKLNSAGLVALGAVMKRLLSNPDFTEGDDKHE